MLVNSASYKKQPVYLNSILSHNYFQKDISITREVILKLYISTIPFTGLFHTCEIQFRKREIQFRENKNQFCKNESQFCKIESQFCKKESQFCKNESQFCKNESQFCKNESQFCKSENQFCNNEGPFCKNENQFCKNESQFCDNEFQLCFTGILQLRVVLMNPNWQRLMRMIYMTNKNLLYEIYSNMAR